MLRSTKNYIALKWISRSYKLDSSGFKDEEMSVHASYNFSEKLRTTYMTETYQYVLLCTNVLNYEEMCTNVCKNVQTLPQNRTIFVM